MSGRLMALTLAVLAFIVLGVLGIVAVVFTQGYFSFTGQDTSAAAASPTAATIIIVPTASVTASVTSEASIDVTSSPTAGPTPQPVVTVEPVTRISVTDTSVQYVMAQTDVNIRSGPGTDFSVAGWLAEGQIAKVTGISADGGWWRVDCPDGSNSGCWVSAGTRYTMPANAPGDGAPTCTDSAALVSDVTIPDGTRFEPGQGFNKIWRVKNTGTCTWEGGYGLVQAGGHLLGAVATYFPLRDTVFPGHSVDLTINMISPSAPDSYQSDWKLQNPQGQYFGVGRNNSPLWVKIVVNGGANTTIAGYIYQDANQNGVYDNGETVLGNQVVWLIPGTACQVKQNPLAAVISDGYGRYTFNGNFSGNYCVGLSGNDGLDDVIGVAVAAGQTLSNINLRAPVPSGSISGYVWNDYCLTNEYGEVLAGNCVTGENGIPQADGMIQPNETYIAGLTVLLQSGICANNNNVPVAAVTDASGRYFFGDLGPGNYCVSIDAASSQNAAKLQPGQWTFPGNGIWYQDILILTNDNAYPVNFGWDFQLR